MPILAALFLVQLTARLDYRRMIKTTTYHKEG